MRAVARPGAARRVDDGGSATLLALSTHYLKMAGAKGAQTVAADSLRRTHHVPCGDNTLLAWEEASGLGIVARRASVGGSRAKSLPP